MALRRINFFYSIIRILGYFVFHIIYRLQVEGRENLPKQGPAVILAKHQFWTDIPIVGLALWRPASYIAKQELFVYPGIRHFIISLGGVPIDRLKPVKSLDSFRYLERLLQERDFIVLYPEGTYYPYSMGRGKHRFIQRILSLQGKNEGRQVNPIAFIPMGIQYEPKTLRSKVHVRIGKPIFAKGEIEALEFTERVMDEIARLSGLHPERVKLESETV